MGCDLKVSNCTAIKLIQWRTSSHCTTRSTGASPRCICHTRHAPVTHQCSPRCTRCQNPFRDRMEKLDLVDSLEKTSISCLYLYILFVSNLHVLFVFACVSHMKSNLVEIRLADDSHQRSKPRSSWQAEQAEHKASPILYHIIVA